MQKIVPCLWFDTQAEEAVTFYTSVVKDSRIRTMTRFTDTGPLPAGTVMTVVFDLQGQEFMALNGGPVFQFTPAISFVLHCGDQAELDFYWDALSEGGVTERCGWLRDRYGVSWQIVPSVIGELMGSGDPARTDRVMRAVLQMDKIDIAAMQSAFAGR
jgi:predicted 3-demethylubiquinone-9 3-methyltransferase (glyoxalase superfamily)